VIFGNSKRPWHLSLLALLLIVLGGFRERGTPDWTLDDTPPPDSPAAAAPAPTAAPDAQALRFISHNVENWLAMERNVDGKVLPDAPKPDEEKRALVTLIARHKPDVFGVCEIGSRADLADLRERLKKAGVDLPHLHHHQGSDDVRALGLLSRYPIVPAAAPADTAFRLAGQRQEMLRGILDATVTTPDGRAFRFLGVHLKSKRETSRYDQAQFRLQEAHRLRDHVEKILTADATARLIVFGDLNDTRRSQAVTAVAGAYGSGRQLLPVPARDSKGQMWTHHWRFEDVYSRIDYIFLTESLRPEADFDNARVLEDPEWRQASDHRPLLVDFPPPR
jgi:endonuclease/exonuclease/phosphatase family metal-dependent hydrolase